MKRILVIVLIVTMLPFTAFGSSELSETSPAVLSFARLTVSIAGAELSRNRDNEPVLRVFFDVTNTSASDVIATFYARDTERTAYQNGEEIPSSISMIDDAREYLNYSRSIYPGVTIRVAEHYKLLDEQSEVTLVVAGRSGEQPLEVTLDLADLSDIQPVPERVLIANPGDISGESGFSGTEAVFESSVLGNYRIKMLRHDFFEHKGQAYIRVYFEFTVVDGLAEGKTAKPHMVTRYFLFQDGIQLGGLAHTVSDSTFGMEKLPEYAAYDADVGLDEPIEYAVVYKLVSDSDVIVKAATYYSDPNKGEPFIGGVFSVE